MKKISVVICGICEPFFSHGLHGFSQKEKILFPLNVSGTGPLRIFPDIINRTPKIRKRFYKETTKERSVISLQLYEVEAVESVH